MEDECATSPVIEFRILAKLVGVLIAINPVSFSCGYKIQRKNQLSRTTATQSYLFNCNNYTAYHDRSFIYAVRVELF